MKFTGRSLRLLKVLFIPDWVGVDLEDSLGEDLSETAILAGGNSVGVSTSATWGFIIWPGLWGDLVDGNWWFLRKYVT
jgi:hypothetical protein